MRLSDYYKFQGRAEALRRLQNDNEPFGDHYRLVAWQGAFRLGQVCMDQIDLPNGKIQDSDEPLSIPATPETDDFVSLPDACHLEALAAAHAENGDYVAATRFQELALKRSVEDYTKKACMTRVNG